MDTCHTTDQIDTFCSYAHNVPFETFWHNVYPEATENYVLEKFDLLRSKPHMLWVRLDDERKHLLMNAVSTYRTVS